MDKFRNFLYNKNDIIIAILIILAAAAVIFFCMKSILEYPERMLDYNSSDLSLVASFFGNVNLI